MINPLTHRSLSSDDTDLGGRPPPLPPPTLPPPLPPSHLHQYQMHAHTRTQKSIHAHLNCGFNRIYQMRKVDDDIIEIV